MLKINLSVSIWRPRRKVVMPTFSQNNLTQFVDTFAKQASIMLDVLKETSDEDSFDPWKYFSAYTMDSVCGEYKFVSIASMIIYFASEK